MGREITFRPATFYLGVADMLAGEVEGQPPVDEPQKSGGGGSEVGRGVDLAEDARGVDEPAGNAPSQQEPQPQEQEQPRGHTNEPRTSGDDTPRQR